MSTRRHTLKMLTALGSGSMLGSTALPAAAEAYPGKPVRLVTPFPAGAGPDVMLRVLGEQLGRKWGQPVVVDNKAGGNGFVAVSAWRQGSTDGYDLIELDNSHITTHPHTFNRLPYNVQNDFAPLGMLLRTYFFIAVASDSPYKSVDDIIAAAKARPGAVNYGSWSLGSSGHIGALRLQSLKDVSMTHIPYRDFGTLYTAVATKEVDWALGSAASAGPMQQSGRVRFLALAAAKRDPLYPDVPATGELPGLRDFEVSGWAGLFGPKAMPASVRDKVAADLITVMSIPEVRQRYRTMGYEAPRLQPADFSELIRRETQDWAQVIRKANLKLD